MGTVWYAVQEAVWRQKTKEQKDNAFDKFLKDSKRKKCSVGHCDRIQSADGIIHGIKPEPSKQSLVNEREQSMKEPKRKDKHFSLH